jgi:hypothetical protein
VAATRSASDDGTIEGMLRCVSPAEPEVRSSALTLALALALSLTLALALALSLTLALALALSLTLALALTRWAPPC